MKNYAAIVTNVSDPRRRGRARLRVPEAFGNTETGWVEAIDSGEGREVRVGDRVTAVVADHGVTFFPARVRRASGRALVSLAAGLGATEVDLPPGRFPSSPLVTATAIGQLALVSTTPVDQDRFMLYAEGDGLSVEVAWIAVEEET